MLITDMTPILSFTSEELFTHLPPALRPEIRTVLALRLPEITQDLVSDKEMRTWNLVFNVRSEITKAIEPLRQSKALGHSLDARVTLYAQPELHAHLAQVEKDLRDIFIVSQVVLTKDPAPPSALATELEGLALSIDKARGEKCARCWIYDENLGTNPAHPQACPRCTTVLQEYYD